MVLVSFWRHPDPAKWYESVRIRIRNTGKKDNNNNNIHSKADIFKFDEM